ncbi:MAG: FHA domain-containing protein [Acidobacteria bacterium]|nr:FHA domain-containing protein [Acidobacteriota bacterium]
MSAKGFFEKLRQWIDGEEDLDEQGEVKARSKWDDFLVAIAREVEAVMQREMFTPPGGPTYIPREYLVFLNPEDDAEWQGEKREGLQRGLHFVLSERAKSLAGDGDFQTRTLAVELRVDAGLERNRFRVQPVWDAETEKTFVEPRKNKKPAEDRQADTDIVAPDRTAKLDRSPGDNLADDEATVVKPRQAAAESDEEATVVKPRKSAAPNFSLLVRRHNDDANLATSMERPFYKDEITIGRGSSKANLAVDLKLEGDMEISRTHARLKKIGDGEFAVTCSGANPIALDGGREIINGESATLKSGDHLVICSYEIVIQ